MNASDPERRRKRRRRILVLASLPVLVAVAAAAVYLMSLSITTQVAIGHYNDGSFTESEEQSSKLVDANLLETWLPYFNRGDAKAGDGDFTAAIDDFEHALELAPQDRKCQVRVNLAHTWELLGDIYEQGGYHQGAVQLYQAAKDVIAAGADECPPSTESGQALGEVSEDVEAKQGDAQQNQDEQDAQEPSESSRLEDLERKQQQSESDKQNDEARENEPGNGGALTDKPW